MSYDYIPLGPYDVDYVPYGGYTDDGSGGVTLHSFMGDVVDRYMTFNYMPEFTRYGLEEVAAQCVNVMEGAGGGSGRWNVHQYVIEQGRDGLAQVEAMLWGWVELSSGDLVRRYKRLFPEALDEHDGKEEAAGRMAGELESMTPAAMPHIVYAGPQQLDNGNWLFFEGWLYDDYPDMTPNQTYAWDCRDEEALCQFRSKHAVPRPW